MAREEALEVEALAAAEPGPPAVAVPFKKKTRWQFAGAFFLYGSIAYEFVRRM